jgi:wobble nucleotide-excising tRNase
MRWDYDQTISAYIGEKRIADQKIADVNDEILKIDQKVSNQKSIAIEEQKKTINIEEAIQNINIGLIELGIDGFKIEKYEDELYQIVRNERCDEAFKTLSEGEKMIISFLYFLELCRGKKNATSTENRKIIVIDDPISSLSHIYVFNVGRLIKNEFFGKKETKEGTINWIHKYEQVFILTHSLYFFYEITETKHEDRKETQKLFRLSKNDDGSNFSKLKYEEIQNDYQAYWYIIKDDKQPSALIDNSMRNIIEYFFNFIEKKDLNNFFLQPCMQANRFQAFCRYINRESHSLGQNIFDFKEFNYNDFKDAFATVFTEAGYEAHYNRMIK